MVFRKSGPLKEHSACSKSHPGLYRDHWCEVTMVIQQVLYTRRLLHFISGMLKDVHCVQTICSRTGNEVMDFKLQEDMASSNMWKTLLVIASAHHWNNLPRMFWYLLPWRSSRIGRTWIHWACLGCLLSQVFLKCGKLWRGTLSPCKCPWETPAWRFMCWF